MKTGIMKNKERGTFANGSRAFTLIEMMIAVGLFSLVIAGSLGVYIMCQRLWRVTSLSMDTSRMASLAIERMICGVGTNSGLRSAAGISVETVRHSHANSSYWNTTTGAPPAAGNAANTLCTYTPYPGDGSWRIAYSNTLEGLKWIDYIKPNRSIVFWPDTAQPASRMSICNYVINSTVSSNAVEGISIYLTVWKKDGMFVSSNQVSAFVKMRN